MNPETAAECLLWLAEQTKPCPDDGENIGWKGSIHTAFGYRPFQDMAHPDCGGTGKVPMFPTLRRVCNGCNSFMGKLMKPCEVCEATYPCDCPCPTCQQHRGKPGLVWACCQGRGWVVAEVHLGLLLEAGRQAGFPLNLITLGSEHPPGIYYRAWCRGQQGDGETPEDALALALVAAVQAQVGLDSGMPD